jgi:hypothetical protein
MLRDIDTELAWRRARRPLDPLALIHSRAEAASA